MSLTGILGTHHVMASIIANGGTEQQKRRFLPRMATGELRGGLALTEPDAGSDVQNIRTTAVRDGDYYIIDGSKMFITNAERGHGFAVLAKTDAAADPPYRGISCFIVEKSESGRRGGTALRQARLPRRRHRRAALPLLSRAGLEPGGRGRGTRVRAGDGRAGGWAASTLRRAPWAWLRRRSKPR